MDYGTTVAIASPSPHQPRRRRECLGELVQIDGSEHAWFEDRGAVCTLLAFVDDATSRLMTLRFVASESAFDYFRATRAYLETHGKPVGNDEPSAPGRNGERNFHKEKRSNETHASTTDPDARLARKSNGEGAKLAFTGHLLMENRNGLVVDACLTRATGTAEPEAALAMLEALPGSGHKTVGADKNYDTAAFVASSRAAGVTPHVAQNINAHRGSNIDGRTTRHAGYRLSQVVRKRIEEANGWIKEVGGMAQTKLRGLERVEWMFVFKAAAYNLIRLPRLLATG